MRTSQAGAGPFGRRSSIYGVVEQYVAIWWTEDDISNVTRKVLTSDVGRSIVRTHIDAILQNEVTRALGAELRIIAERFGEEGKLSLQRKLNSVYAAQVERLAKRLAELESELEAASPGYEKRLKAFEYRLDQLSSSLESWLDEPTRSLQDLVTENLANFKSELKDITNKSARKAQKNAEQIEHNVNLIIQTELYALVLSAVREHVKSLSFEKEELSNKQVAATMGISLRAAKRMRRANVS